MLQGLRSAGYSKQLVQSSMSAARAPRHSVVDHLVNVEARKKKFEQAEQMRKVASAMLLLSYILKTY